jgi:hypothetical protein
VTGIRRIALVTFLVTGLLLSLSTLLTSSAATQDTSQTTDPNPCLGPPVTPAKNVTGTYVRTSARNDCGIFTVVWLMRYQADQSAWRTIFERYVQPGTTGQIEWNCWGTGTFTYRSIHWDPNMAFHKISPPVEITC